MDIAPPEKEGAGKAGRLMHPQPHAQDKKAHELVTTGSPEATRPSLRNGFNGFLRARPGDRAFLPPSPARCVSIDTNLISASGYQAHTTSPSALAPFVNASPKRPSHPAPNVRDGRDAPLSGAGWREQVQVICPTPQAKCLRHNGTTGKSVVKCKILSSDKQLLPPSASLRGASATKQSRALVPSKSACRTNLSSQGSA